MKSIFCIDNIFNNQNLRTSNIDLEILVDCFLRSCAIKDNEIARNIIHHLMMLCSPFPAYVIAWVYIIPWYFIQTPVKLLLLQIANSNFLSYSIPCIKSLGKIAQRNITRELIPFRVVAFLFLPHLTLHQVD